jgi:phospholipid/cholesterol/gamma-HCH transport system substrate-binding protein
VRPRRGVGTWRSVLPGVLILTGLVITSTLVFFMDTIRRALLEGPHIVVLATEARGLVPGADVWIAGSPSGRVADVRFGDPNGPYPEHLVIQAVLHRPALPYLRSGTTAHIGSSALLAPVVLKLQPGAPGGPPFDPSDTLHVVPDRTKERFLALADEGKSVSDSLAEVLSRLADRLDRGPGTLARVRRDTALLNVLPRIVGSAADLSAVLESDQALPALLASDSVGATLARIAGGLRELAVDRRAAGVVDTVAALVATLERISERLARMDADLRAGRGTAGRALYDDELHRQQLLFRARRDSVVAELMREPWRWLRLKLF